MRSLRAVKEAIRNALWWPIWSSGRGSLPVARCQLISAARAQLLASARPARCCHCVNTNSTVIGIDDGRCVGSGSQQTNHRCRNGRNFVCQIGIRVRLMAKACLCWQLNLNFFVLFFFGVEILSSLYLDLQ